MAETSGPSETDLDRLADLIRRQAAEEAEEIRAQAERRARDIRSAAEAEARGVREVAEQEGMRRGRRRAAEIVALAEVEARLEALRDREALIASVLQRAGEQLDGGDSPAQPEPIFTALVREALDIVADRPATVRLPAGGDALIEPMRRELGGAGVTVELAPPGSGDPLIVASDDGRLRFDNSFAARLRRSHERLRWLAHEALFGEEGTAP